MIIILLNQVIKLRLTNVAPPVTTALIQVQTQYMQACQFVSDYVFNHDFELNSNKLSHVLYHDIRQRFALKAQLASSVFKTVTARYKTVQSQLRQKPYRVNDGEKWLSIPKDLPWLWQPVQFKRPQADLVRNRDYSFVADKQQLSLQTLGKRIKTTFTASGFKQYLDGTWKLGTAKLLRADHKWYLHIAVSKTVPDVDAQTQSTNVIGIDRGLRFLATTYDTQGKTRFFSGRQILRKHAYYQKRRAALQAIGTKSSKHKLKRLSGKENRWLSDVNHQLSKTLITRYGVNSLFVIEDLTNVTFDTDNLPKSLRNSNRSWAFYQLEHYLTYKAHANQSNVLKVSAAYTSQRCPKCGLIRKSNRNHNSHEYRCQNCGYRSNDDRLGAMNIQQLGTQFVSGTVKPKFVFNTNLDA
ncbi:RNA-guided endonuclease TnpB family protein [Loigolactobacillus jiayinensis]|uniref:RNA-guided endonuclease TnpB family protein n=1 Tax=Loigolactobacillus jiayinensis TaxID=2486016 RepID=A0ABW1RFP8_9LACO|nr:RNA-guided endonuclease TnpB family protein [Loigolactobacillus jiayinensis]